jgi:hypothetical protein
MHPAPPIPLAPNWRIISEAADESYPQHQETLLAAETRKAASFSGNNLFLALHPDNKKGHSPKEYPLTNKVNRFG